MNKTVIVYTATVCVWISWSMTWVAIYSNKHYHFEKCILVYLQYQVLSIYEEYPFLTKPSSFEEISVFYFSCWLHSVTFIYLASHWIVSSLPPFPTTPIYKVLLEGKSGVGGWRPSPPLPTPTFKVFPQVSPSLYSFFIPPFPQTWSASLVMKHCLEFFILHCLGYHSYSEVQFCLAKRPHVALIGGADIQYYHQRLGEVQVEVQQSDLHSKINIVSHSNTKSSTHVLL